MADLDQGELTRCYCGNVGRMQGDLLVCNQCIAQGREGAPWPGDYYKKTGLFADRSREFNPSIRVRPAHHGHPRLSPINSNNYGVYSSSQEIDTRKEMYGNIILKSRIDLADLCDLYMFKVVVEVGTDNGQFANELLIRSQNIKLYCVDNWLPYEDIPHDRSSARANSYNSLDPFVKKGRAVILEMNSVDAPKHINEKVDLVYIDAAHDEENVNKDIHVWYQKLRVGGILSGHDYGFPSVKNQVKKFAKEIDCDIHVIREEPELAQPSWFIWKRS